jgi:uncharacterized protein (DUF58 family)
MRAVLRRLPELLDRLPTRQAVGEVAGTVTPLGWTVAGLAAVTGLAAAWTGWRELTVIAVSCAVALLIAVPFALGGFSVDVTVAPSARRVAEGDAATCTITVHNSGGRTLGRVRVDAPVRLPGGRSQVAAVDAGRLGPGASHTGVPVVIDTGRRGVVVIGPAMSVRGDPLGLLRRMVAFGEPTEILVHPRTARISPTGAGLLRDLEGQTSTDISMNDVAFHALREYVPGDDLRHVHAMTSARMGRLMVRQFVDTRTAHVAVLVSGTTAEYPHPQDHETALSVGGSVALRAVDDAQRVAVFAGGQSTGRTGRLSRRTVLDSLSRATLGEPGSDLPALVSRATRTAPDTSLAVLVTGAGTTVAELRRVATRFGANVRVVAVRVDPAASPHARRAGQLTVITVGSLGELRTALRAVVRA